jgi:hypothetical protein
MSVKDLFKADEFLALLDSTASLTMCLLSKMRRRSENLITLESPDCFSVVDKTKRVHIVSCASAEADELVSLRLQNVDQLAATLLLFAFVDLKRFMLLQEAWMPLLPQFESQIRGFINVWKPSLSYTPTETAISGVANVLHEMINKWASMLDANRTYSVPSNLFKLSLMNDKKCDRCGKHTTYMYVQPVLLLVY